MASYIAPIKTELDANMHQICKLFVTIGFPSESPRWFNFGGFNMDTKVLTISSTQKPDKLFFEVDTPFKWVNVHTFWQEFKEYRTEFLKEHYPTIKTF